MPTFLFVILSNFLFWLLWIVVELHRRRRQETPEVPFSLLLTFITLNTLLFEQTNLFRFGVLMVLIVAIWEARDFVLRGAPEVSLGGSVAAGCFGLVVLTYCAVTFINEHLHLGIG
ncbi:MAG: hypothetical protein GY952_13040 [Rhodobacteraceae bacterium]|nr:hypothetical protein [Paracoccaceae bacterium]